MITPTRRRACTPCRGDRQSKIEHDLLSLLTARHFADAGTLDFSSFDSHARSFLRHERSPHRTRHPSLSGFQTGSAFYGLAADRAFTGQARSEPTIPLTSRTRVLEAPISLRWWVESIGAHPCPSSRPLKKLPYFFDAAAQNRIPTDRPHWTAFSGARTVLTKTETWRKLR